MLLIEALSKLSVYGGVAVHTCGLKPHLVDRGGKIKAYSIRADDKGIYYVLERPPFFTDDDYLKEEGWVVMTQEEYEKLVRPFDIEVFNTKKRLQEVLLNLYTPSIP